jgi:hypothetical protein
MTALWLRPQPAPQLLSPRIAGVGQKESFEQTNKRSECASFVKVIASIEDPAIIKKILDYLDDNTPCVTTALQPECRAPPLAELLEGF